jgi:hypothetical protein
MRTPQGHPRGETESRFLGHAGSRQFGRPFQAPKIADARSFGLGRRIGSNPPVAGWRRTMTPQDVRACIAVLSRSGRFLRGDQESLPRPEHLFIQPVVAGVAFGSLLRPFALETSGRGIRHALDQPDDPFPSLPRKVEVSRSSSWLFRPLREPYQLQSANTRDKDLKKHGDLDWQAHSGTEAVHDRLSATASERCSSSGVAQARCRFSILSKVIASRAWSCATACLTGWLTGFAVAVDRTTCTFLVVFATAGGSMTAAPGGT